MDVNAQDNLKGKALHSAVKQEHHVISALLVAEGKTDVDCTTWLTWSSCNWVESVGND